MVRPGRPPKPVEKDGVCISCRFARQQFRESCYCTKYGITIGYSKTECKGYESDDYEIWERTDYD